MFSLAFYLHERSFKKRVGSTILQFFTLARVQNIKELFFFPHAFHEQSGAGSKTSCIFYSHARSFFAKKFNELVKSRLDVSWQLQNDFMLVAEKKFFHGYRRETVFFTFVAVKAFFSRLHVKCKALTVNETNQTDGWVRAQATLSQNSGFRRTLIQNGGFWRLQSRWECCTFSQFEPVLSIIFAKKL